MRIGYVRVSTADQNLHLQHDALQAAGCERLFSDTVSGARVDRPGLTAALSACRSGDTLVMWKLDRLGRSLPHLVEIVQDVYARGVGFTSLQEQMDTTTSGGKLIFHIFASLATFERDLIRERTNAGLAAARARGRHGGRPKGVDQKKQKAALAYRGGLQAEERMARAAAALERVGLGQRMDHKPQELSGGQQQRVAIARALVTQPALLLADEPTGALDTRTSAEVMELLTDLNQRSGMTVVLVTHEPDVARYARRLLEIRDGQLQRDVPTAEAWVDQNPHAPSAAVGPVVRARRVGRLPVARQWRKSA